MTAPAANPLAAWFETITGALNAIGEISKTEALDAIEKHGLELGLLHVLPEPGTAQSDAAKALGLTDEDFLPGKVRAPHTAEEYERLLAERTRALIELEQQFEAAIKAHAEMRQLDFERYQAAKASADGAYRERDRLVAALSKVFPSHLMRHPSTDESWDDDWRWIVCVHLPTGSATWHIHDSELPWFDHLTETINDWDGHSTEEKHKRLAKIERIWLSVVVRNPARPQNGVGRTTA